ncbi:uncharacterized protein LOC143058212 [Mytilus galloprovincialis]|uniref:uncharacterized protein LOC143058212 n=1 Tax=Mytilus galloprovincialis TaxID=29158 RepID=UPI003F7CBF94
MDTDQKRIYWLDFDTGKVQSARPNGSDVAEIFDSSATSYDFVIKGDNIYCTSYKKIIKFSKYPGTTSQVLFTDISVINSLLVLSTTETLKYELQKLCCVEQQRRNWENVSGIPTLSRIRKTESYTEGHRHRYVSTGKCF